MTRSAIYLRFWAENGPNRNGIPARKAKPDTVSVFAPPPAPPTRSTHPLPLPCDGDVALSQPRRTALSLPRDGGALSHIRHITAPSTSLASFVQRSPTNLPHGGRYYQGTEDLPLPPELLLPTDGHGGGQVFQICSDGLGTEAVGELSWSSVEAGENEEGAAVVAFSCMARLTASLPSSALTERRCHRSLASMRRPYFSAFSCKDVLLLDLLHREAVQDQREDDGVFARSSFKTVSSSSRLLLRWLRFDLALSEDAFTSLVKELVV
ncbi:uncharacterized protein LOC124662461 [Lolium rigidum]|uniref:uncharacterized protein LOC124662461 n=1 Tax=Lolium rigidum TaxID=89674 RepID=UPI001F5CF4B8|nr:uncharacterized protein LOC124662461 [Lolium rigidum]